MVSEANPMVNGPWLHQSIGPSGPIQNLRYSQGSVKSTQTHRWDVNPDVASESPFLTLNVLGTAKRAVVTDGLNLETWATPHN